MGKEAHSGPVYGAKSLLWSFGPYTQTGSSGASTVLFTANSKRVVPVYEDWYLTEAHLACSTNSSGDAVVAVYIKSEGGSTTGIAARLDGKPSTVSQTCFSFVYSSASAANSTNWSTFAAATASPGEYEGLYVPAGSTIRIVSSGVNLIGGLQVNVMGFIRWISSTRAE